MIIISGGYHIIYLMMHGARRTLAFSMLPGPRDVGEIHPVHTRTLEDGLYGRLVAREERHEKGTPVGPVGSG